MVEQYTALR